MQAPPHPGLVPLFQASPAGHAATAAHLLGQHLPGDARPEHEQDAGEGGPIVDARPAALGLGRFPGQERLDHFPKFVGYEFLSHTFTLPVTGFC